MFGQLIITGLAVGALYALLALGVVLIHKVSSVGNFAAGELAMFCAFIGHMLFSEANFPYWVMFPLCLGISFLIGMLVERVLIRPVAHAPILTIIMVTLGLNIMLNSTATVLWADRQPYRFPAPIPGEALQWGHLVISRTSLFILGITLILALVLYLYFNFAKTGLGARAVAQSPTNASLMGVNVNQVMSISWAISTALGAVAGMLFANILFLDTFMMTPILFSAFVGATLGGLNSMPGAIVGGLGLGLMETVFIGYFSAEYRSIFTFSIVILVLLFIPSGIFGTLIRRKV